MRSSRMLVGVIALATSHAPVASGQGSADSVMGRWDLTLQAAGRELPSWLEIRHSGRSTLFGRFVGPVGSARPIAKIEITGGVLRFSIPAQWEEDQGDLSFEARLDGERLVGSMTSGDGTRTSWSGTRAPALRSRPAPVWGAPVRLLNGRDLTGWHALGDNQWQVANGVLRSPKSGSNLATDATFGDFKLHVEFRYPRGSNSGVYLRGRYEVQIADAVDREAGWDLLLGAVYGFLPPNRLAARGPNEWQSFDVTLVGRMITVVVNGRTVICDREIPGITGGALDSNEGAPGPIFLQGDHGPVEFRNITLTPVR